MQSKAFFFPAQEPQEFKGKQHSAPAFTDGPGFFFPLVLKNICSAI